MEKKIMKNVNFRPSLSLSSTVFFPSMWCVNNEKFLKFKKCKKIAYTHTLKD